MIKQPTPDDCDSPDSTSLDIFEDTSSKNMYTSVLSSYRTDIKLTTMTLIIEIEGALVVPTTFGLIPITKIDLPDLGRSRKKIRIQGSEFDDGIISARFKKCIRGIRRCHKENAFPNSVVMDVNINGKILSMKLSNGKIQLCGATSMDQGYNSVFFVLKKITEIQKILDWIHENPEQTRIIINGIRDEARRWFNGIPCDSSSDLDLEIRQLFEYCEYSDDESTDSYDCETRSSTNEAESESEECPTNKEGQHKIPKKLWTLLVGRISEFESYDDFMNDLSWFCNVKQIATLPLRTIEMYRSMVNISYNLNRRIDLHKFKCYIHSLSKTRFYVRYDSAVQPSLTLEAPDTVPYLNFFDSDCGDLNEGKVDSMFGNMPDIKDCLTSRSFVSGSKSTYHRRKSNYNHSIIVHRSGAITQSGLGDQAMFEVAENVLKITRDYFHSLNKLPKITDRLTIDSVLEV